MGAPVRTPRDSWIAAGLRALGAGGPDAVRIETLAEALGVTKGGFYGQFDDRGALLDEMLDNWERVVTDDVIARVERGGGDARDKLRRLSALAQSSDELMRVELAIREWSRRDAAVAKRLRKLDNRRLVYMRGLFAEFVADPHDVELRAMLMLSVFVAHHYIAGDNRGGQLTRDELRSLASERLLS